MYGPVRGSRVERILRLVKATSSNLLNQLENLFSAGSGRVVPFRFHLFQKDHPQRD